MKKLTILFILMISLISQNVLADRLEFTPKEKGFFDLEYVSSNISSGDYLFSLLNRLDIIEEISAGCNYNKCYSITLLESKIWAPSTQIICESNGQESSQPIVDIGFINLGYGWAEQIFNVSNGFTCSGNVKLILNKVRYEGKGSSFWYPFDRYWWQLPIKKSDNKEPNIIVRYDEKFPLPKYINIALFNLSEQRPIVKKVLKSNEPFTSMGYKEFNFGVLSREYPEEVLISIQSERRSWFSKEILAFWIILILLLFLVSYFKKMKKPKRLLFALPIVLYIFDTLVIKSPPMSLMTFLIISAYIIMGLYEFKEYKNQKTHKLLIKDKSHMLMEINNLSDTSPSFKKAEVVGKGEGYLATTNVDLHNEKISLKSLKKMIPVIKDRPFINNEHDPSKPPLGRILNVKIKKLDDGEYGIFAEFEFFDRGAMNLKGGFSIEFTENV